MQTMPRHRSSQELHTACMVLLSLWLRHPRLACTDLLRDVMSPHNDLAAAATS